MPRLPRPLPDSHFLDLCVPTGASVSLPAGSTCPTCTLAPQAWLAADCTSGAPHLPFSASHTQRRQGQSSVWPCGDPYPPRTKAQVLIVARDTHLCSPRVTRCSQTHQCPPPPRPESAALLSPLSWLSLPLGLPLDSSSQPQASLLPSRHWGCGGAVLTSLIHILVRISKPLGHGARSLLSPLEQGTWSVFVE